MRAWALAAATAVVASLSLAPAAAAADDPPVNEQNRRAVYSGLFAMAANVNGPLPGGDADASRRIPTSSFSLVGAALAQAYEDAPWLDPDDAALVFGEALEASSCAQPCVPAEQSATQMLRRAEEAVQSQEIPAAQRELAFVYTNAITEVAVELGRGKAVKSLGQAIPALPPESAGQRLAACAAESEACGEATDQVFAGYLQGTSVDATPAELNETAAISGGEMTVTFGDAVMLPLPAEGETGDLRVLEGETITFTLPRAPVRLTAEGTLTLNLSAVQPEVTPPEQVPLASQVEFSELVSRDEDCDCVPDDELLAQQTTALREWFDRALALATPDPANPRKQLVVSEALGWLRQVELRGAAEGTDPVSIEFREKSDRMSAAITAAVEAGVRDAHSRCVAGEPEQFLLLLQHTRSAQLMGASDEDPRLAECQAKAEAVAADPARGAELAAKAAALVELTRANMATTVATANFNERVRLRDIQNKAYWDAGRPEREAVAAAVAKINTTLDQSKAVALMVADFIAIAGNPKLAKQVTTVVNATHGIATAVTGAFSGFMQLGGHIATGNFLGAAMSGIGMIQHIAKAAGLLNGLWTGQTADPGEPEKSADQMLSEQIAQVSSQVAALGETMQERFDVVDRKLNTIYAQMTQGFASLEARLGEIGHGVDVIGETVTRIEGRLDQFERNMLAIAQANVEAELWNAINTGVGSGPMGEDSFREVSEDLYTHATTVSRGVTVFDSPGPSADGAVAERLAGIAGDEEEGTPSHTLERNVRYLGFLASTGTQEGNPAIGTFGNSGEGLRGLPNFREWALASKAYARMVMEQPIAVHPNMVREVRTNLDELQRDGELLKTRIGALSKDGPLFDDLLRLHDLRGDAFLNELVAARNAWLTPQRLDNAVLNGGPERPVAMDSPVTTGCELELAAPPALALDTMFKPQYSLVQRLGTDLGAVRLCGDATWVEMRECPRDFNAQCGKLQISLHSEYRQPDGAWTRLRTAHWKNPSEFEVCSAGDSPRGGDGETAPADQCQSAALVALRGWDNSYRQAFTPTLGTEPAGLGPVHEAVIARVRAKLDELQRALMAHLRTRLAAAGDPLRAVGERLTDAKALIRAFAALGFPQALVRDEQLRLLLFGSEAVLDRDLVADGLAGTKWQRDVDPIIGLLAERHSTGDAALGSSIDGWQQAILDGRHSETHQLIEVTLEDLKIAQRIASPVAIPADGTRVGATLAAGGTTATGATVSATDPLSARITLPKRGAVLMTEQAVDGGVGRQVQIRVPAADPEDPLLLEFRVDASRVPSAAALRPVRDGVPVADCTTPGVTAPDPCVTARDVLADGDVRLKVVSSRGSTWSFAGGGTTQPPSNPAPGSNPAPNPGPNPAPGTGPNPAPGTGPSPAPESQPNTPPAPGATPAPTRRGACAGLRGARRTACIKRKCGKLNKKKTKARYRACVKRVTRRR